MMGRPLRRSTSVALGGGIDLQTPPLSRVPGTLLDCVNFTSPPTGGGYERFRGIARFDGSGRGREDVSSVAYDKRAIRSVFTMRGETYATVNFSDRVRVVHAGPSGWDYLGDHVEGGGNVPLLISFSHAWLDGRPTSNNREMQWQVPHSQNRYLRSMPNFDIQFSGDSTVEAYEMFSEWWEEAGELEGTIVSFSSMITGKDVTDNFAKGNRFGIGGYPPDEWDFAEAKPDQYFVERYRSESSNRYYRRSRRWYLLKSLLVDGDDFWAMPNQSSVAESEWDDGGALYRYPFERIGSLAGDSATGELGLEFYLDTSFDGFRDVSYSLDHYPVFVQVSLPFYDSTTHEYRGGNAAVLSCMVDPLTFGDGLFRSSDTVDRVEVGNFYGNLDRQRAYVVNGNSRAVEFDGRRIRAIKTGLNDDLDKPTHVAVHGLHLWLATKGGQLHYSQTGNPRKFGGATSGTIGVGDEITGMIGDYYGALLIFCRNKTFMLTGREEDDFEMKQLSNNSGALPNSVQLGEQPICFDDRGVRVVSTTEQYGDLSLSTVSERVRPHIDRWRENRVKPVASMVYRSKNQYWLFMGNREVLVGTWVTGSDGLSIEWSRLSLNRDVTCAWSGEDANGDEIVLVGARDGYVYQVDVGETMDGEPVEAFLVLSTMSMGLPNHKKRLYRLEMEVSSGGESSYHMGIRTDYGKDWKGSAGYRVSGRRQEFVGSGIPFDTVDFPGIERTNWVANDETRTLFRNIEVSVATSPFGTQPLSPFTVTGMNIDWEPLREVYDGGAPAGGVVSPGGSGLTDP